jgi:MFS transporter, DHA1 family, multidrug resistance protein
MTMLRRLYVDREISPWTVSYLVGISSALSGFAQFSYNPILPQVQQELQTSLYWVNMTVTVFTVSMAVMQLVFGMIADRKGRRIALLIGMSLYVVASFGAAFSETVVTLLVYRIIQGMGAAGIPVVAAAVIGDLFEGASRSKAMGNYQLIMALSPALGPLIGGIIGARYSYWGVFLFLALIGLILLAANFFWLKESKSVTKTGHKFSLYSFKVFIQHRKGAAVMLIGGVQAFAATILMVFMPNMFHNIFAASPEMIGLSFLLMSSSFMISVKFSGLLERKWGIEKAFVFGCWMNALSIILCSMFMMSSLSAAILLFCFYGSTFALAMPAAATMITGIFPEDRATAIAVYNVCRNIGMAVAPMLGAALYITNSTLVLLGVTALIYALGVGIGGYVVVSRSVHGQIH